MPFAACSRTASGIELINAITPMTETNKISIISSEDIVTHNGPFHCDDVLATALAKHFPINGECREWGGITRTRDVSLLAEAREAGALLIDVGGEYSPERGLFDHHFKGSPLREDGSQYASAGLIAKGLQIPAWLQEVCRKVDAVDTGTKIPDWQLSLTVHKCNPLSGDDKEFRHRFEFLVGVFWTVIEYADSEASFVQGIINHPEVQGWVQEHNAALEASASRIREAFNQAGPVLFLEQYEPALFEVAAEAPESKLFSVYPSPGGEWMIQQIPVEKGSFAGRKQLPEAWAGKRGEELDALTGITGCVFTHPGRFIGGHKNLQGALSMAQLATSM